MHSPYNIIASFTHGLCSMHHNFCMRWPCSFTWCYDHNIILHHVPLQGSLCAMSHIWYCSFHHVPYISSLHCSPVLSHSHYILDVMLPCCLSIYNVPLHCSLVPYPMYFSLPMFPTFLPYIVPLCWVPHIIFLVLCYHVIFPYIMFPYNVLLHPVPCIFPFHSSLVPRSLVFLCTMFHSWFLSAIFPASCNTLYASFPSN